MSDRRWNLPIAGDMDLEEAEVLCTGEGTLPGGGAADVGAVAARCSCTS